MPLTDSMIRALKPRSQSYKVTDERGLYLEVSPAGGRWWRLKYYRPVTKKENRLSLGVYPDIGLKDARERRDEARRMVARGLDPAEQRKLGKQEAQSRERNSFEGVAREWFRKQSPRWAASHSSRLLRLLERDIFPFRGFGRRPIADLTPPQILEMLRPIEARSPETSHRALRACSQIFRFGIATSCCRSDPTRDLRGALAPAIRGHFAATIEPNRLGAILRAFDAYKGSPAVCAALRLAPLLFVRPGELRTAKWSDFSFERAEWRYRVTKTNVDHIVPLSKQAVSILNWLHDFTGSNIYLFPSSRGGGRPMSDNAVLVAMRSMEIGKDEMTGHGFRAVARTILDEDLGFRVDVIEHQLAHAVKDANGRAYNRTQFLPDRHGMMQVWADHLDMVKQSRSAVQG